MFGIKKLFRERTIHELFDITLLAKALFAVIEIAGGIAAYFVTQHFLVQVATIVTRGELMEDPHDFISVFLLHTAQGFTLGVQHFTSIYLLAHGIVKLWLIIGLLREKLWYYPIAMTIFTGFVAYQLYNYLYTQSLWMIVISVVDVIVIVLTWHEYRYLSRKRNTPAS